MVGSSNSNEEREAEEKHSSNREAEEPTVLHHGERENEEVNLPCGYRFSPTDCELIAYYLNNMVLGRPPPLNIIKEIDVYAYDPDQLPISEFRYGKSNQAYYFTQIDQQKNSQGVRPRLIRERGYWNVTDEDVEIPLFDRIIGFKNIFTFYWGKSPVGENSGWRMHEYRANPELFPVYYEVEHIKKEIEGLVICKIRYKELGDGDGKEEERRVELELLAKSNSTHEEENQIGNTTTNEPNSTSKGTGDSEE